MHKTTSTLDMQEEKIQALLKQTPVSAYGAIVAAFAACLILTWYHYTPFMVGWVAGITLVSGMRLRLYSEYRSCLPSSTCHWQDLARRYQRLLIVSGFLWGLLAAFPRSDLPMELHIFPLLGPAIVAVAAISNYAVCIKQYQLFLGSLITSLFLLLAITTGIKAIPMILIFGILGLLLNVTAMRFSRILEESFLIRKASQRMQSELGQANNHLARQRELTIQEENIARHVFEQLTLSSEHAMPGVYTWNQAMGNLSGDLIQLARGPEDSIYVFLGDFTGHGLPAALGAVPASTVFRTMVGKGLGISEIAEELNRKLHSLLPTGYFCCAAILKLSPNRRHVTLWNGGLPPVLILHGYGSTIQKIGSDNLPLGVTGGNEFSGKCSEWTLAAQDRLLIYSDGLTEAENIHGEMWGRERLEDFLMQCDNSRTVLQPLKEEILEFTHLAPPSDDISFVEIEAGGDVSTQ